MANLNDRWIYNPKKRLAKRRCNNLKPVLKKRGKTNGKALGRSLEVDVVRTRGV
jgi:hypothetical protein